MFRDARDRKFPEKTTTLNRRNVLKINDLPE